MTRMIATAPRKLTKIELVDIKLLVMQSRPVLLPPKKETHEPKE